jgi:mersacidin/lichenicidin family type 2 lantibiotic
VKKKDVIRAWKDLEFRRSLAPSQRALLPEHPAGLVELADAQLDQAAGGNNPHPGTWNLACFSVWCVPTAQCTPGPTCPQ